ncbi:uncharacterized protein LOC106651975 [Trichogramma pretiosum]|uniref:uncharacterized protein LOC106651975 n=1 Tax=Trichogramma pretiosum TaxID=7493 RepID=UPI0006C96ED9|nr:uncharacterized protein LOC106651975 [Trichogramma pretiosum]
MGEELGERITTETLRKIASNEEYAENEMLCVAEYLIDLYEYDAEAHFGLVVSDEPAQCGELDKLKELDVRKEPFFLIYSKAARHWVCLAVTYLHNSVVVLYKDSLGAQIPHTLRDAIGNCLQSETVRFESHRGTEQNDENSSGPICLRNLQVLMKGLKSDTIKVPLVEKFQKVRFCTQYGVQNVKREFRLWLQKYLLGGLEALCAELCSDPDYPSFRDEVGLFLDDCSRLLRETYLLSSAYTGLLKSEAKEKQQDPRHETDYKTMKAMKDARSAFYRNQEVSRSIKSDENDFVDIDDGHRVYNLDIQERYPEQMQKFTKIFAVLAQAEMNEELERVLQKVSQMLRLDYAKIRVYFDKAKATVRRPELMAAARNSDCNAPPSAAAQIEKAAAALKLKSKHIRDAQKADAADKKIKSWDQLVSELVLDVQHDDLTSKEDVDRQIREIRESYAKIMKHYAAWKDKGVGEIMAWANERKAEEKPFEVEAIEEAVAILDRANEIATGGQRLRATQILSVLVFVRSTESYHGKLCQIESGEGKTVIVSLLAVTMLLQGEKSVDVITSNAVLAQEGVDSRKLFYAIFNASCATNAPDKSYAQGPRRCYLADVVYGSISDFQFDYLRDTAEGLGTLSGRQFGRVILDEVDNMLVDNGRHIAKISSPFAGMENLKYIYLRIWNELLDAESELIDDFQEKIDGFAGLKSVKRMAVDEFVKIFDASMIGRLEERIKANLKDLDYKFVPTHCLRYAKSMIPKWIGNAIRARYFIRENEQYSLKEANGELAIIPVDYSNTGVTLKNTVWSYGLHQFIQIKHNLRVTPESLTSSCVSNYAYIGKYGNRIFGLTGTLGSKAEQDLLSSIYNVDYARVPTYKTKLFEEYRGVVVPDDEWSFEIALMAAGMIKYSGRAVLIICKTIADLMLLEEHFAAFKDLMSSDCPMRLKKFQDEECVDVTRDTVLPGDVIVATNIAGRGADFKTSKELEARGGLHVYVGFCPDNERVREQAFFRTSRQGNRGSAQLVVRESEIKKLNLDTSDCSEVDFDEVKRRIDIIERERLSDIKLTKVDVLRYEDALFTLFSDLCQELKNNNVITWGHSYLMKDLKELWAFWLEDQNFEGKKYSMKEASYIFYSFKNHERTRRIISGTVTQNPYYGILQADFFMKNDEVDKAKAALINAICLSKNANVMYPAFLMLFDSTLEEKGRLMPRFREFLAKVFACGNSTANDKYAIYAAEILEYLTISQAGLSEEIEHIERRIFNDEHNYGFKRILIKPAKGKENVLVKQFAAKLTCLKVYRSNVELLLEAFEGSDTNNLAVSKRIGDYLKHFKPDTKEEKQTKDLMIEPELSELGSKGLKTIYGLKKLGLIPEATAEKSRSQLMAALALIARSTAFPPLSFAVANVTSVMIAEAVASIVLALFKENSSVDDMVHKSEYLQGKSLNYVVSLMTSGDLNHDVCVKIFLRMVRSYRESYYILEHSNDSNMKLIKNVNSTEISRMAKTLDEYGEYGTANWTRRVKVPEALVAHFFESDIMNTGIAQLVEFVVEKESSSNGKVDNVDAKHENIDKTPTFYYPPKEWQGVTKIESFIARAAPKKFGGSFEEVSKQFSQGSSYFVTVRFPSEDLLKDTEYSSISPTKLPAIAMLERDRGSLVKLRSIDETTKQAYSSRQTELLRKKEFWAVLRNEIAEILAISKFFEQNGREHANYSMALVQMLHYCKSADLGAPIGKLITSEQCNVLVKQFRLKHEIA